MAEIKRHGSLAEPIKCAEARYQRDEYVKWCGAYIDSKTTLCKKVSQKLHKPAPGVYVDEILVREANGQENVFFFDISAALNAEGKELEKVADQMGLK
jgi:hypothetical protein